MRSIKISLLTIFVLSFLTACQSNQPQVVEQPKPKSSPAQTERVPAKPVEKAEAKPEVKETSSEYVSTIYFAPKMYKIDAFTAAKLNLLAEEIRAQNPKTISVTGHSDKLNSEKEENDIALKRAIAVAEYFENTGLFDNPLVPITAEGAGAAKPAEKHEDITLRDKNRRVEIGIEK